MKKRDRLIAALLLTAMGLFPACDIFEECSTCKLITEAADGSKTETTPLPFCGEDLREKEDQLPVTVGGVTTYWECN